MFSLCVCVCFHCVCVRLVISSLSLLRPVEFTVSQSEKWRSHFSAIRAVYLQRVTTLTKWFHCLQMSSAAKRHQRKHLFLVILQSAGSACTHVSRAVTRVTNDYSGPPKCCHGSPSSLSSKTILQTQQESLPFFSQVCLIVQIFRIKLSSVEFETIREWFLTTRDTSPGEWDDLLQGWAYRPLFSHPYSPRYHTLH